MSRLSFCQMTWLAVAFCAAVAISSPAQTLTTLISFNGPDGQGPAATLTRGTDGNFYGTTASGGANGNFGTIFKITPDGTLTTLYNFCSQANCTDGATPNAQLLLAKDGNFYGTTYLGGSYCVSSNLPQTGCGTVFKITPDGQFTSLHSFCRQGSFSCYDGSNPYAALIQGVDGNLYGTTPYGGANPNDINCFCSGFGTIFRITTAGQLTTIFQFCNMTNSAGYCLDGGGPWGGVYQTANGSLYGTLYGGGRGIDNSGGTIYSLSSSGTFVTLHNFCSQTNCADGAYPFDSLTRGTDGNFYGVTRNGGIGGTVGGGTVFKITPAGQFTTIHRFQGSQGADPYAALIQANDGAFYGTNDNTVFRITSTGTFRTVYTFCSLGNCADGSIPAGGLAQGPNGSLYGTTYYGGADGDGTVFSLSANAGSVR